MTTNRAAGRRLARRAGALCGFGVLLGSLVASPATGVEATIAAAVDPDGS